jgi:hypothetical protein
MKRPRIDSLISNHIQIKTKQKLFAFLLFGLTAHLPAAVASAATSDVTSTAASDVASVTVAGVVTDTFSLFHSNPQIRDIETISDTPRSSRAPGSYFGSV